MRQVLRTGLSRNSMAPRSTRSRTTSGSLSALRAITGTVPSAPRMRSSVSAPEIPDMWMSSSTAAGRSRASAAMQASPPSRRTVRNPASSTQSPISERRHSSSSTTKTSGQDSAGSVRCSMVSGRGASGAVEIARAGMDGLVESVHKQAPGQPDVPVHQGARLRKLLVSMRNSNVTVRLVPPPPTGAPSTRVHLTGTWPSRMGQRPSERACSRSPSASRAPSRRAGSEANSSARRMNEAAWARANSPSPWVVRRRRSS